MKQLLIVFSLLTFIQNSYEQEFRIGNSINEFSIEFLKTIREVGGSNLNIALSPFTAWSLLSIISEGARENTARQLESTLRIPKIKNELHKNYNELSLDIMRPVENIDLLLSNAIFTNDEYKLNDTFRQIAKKYYNVDVHPTNFKNTQAASDMINKHIAKATKDRIKDLMNPSELNDAFIVMTSALYFKGNWQTPFNISQTFDDMFYDQKGNAQGLVKMMYQSGSLPYKRMEDLNLHALELPYGNEGKMSMIVLLPFIGQTVDAILKSLNYEQFNRIIDELVVVGENYADEDIDIYLPKFLIKSDLNLNVVLDKMGIKDVFNEEKADLLGIFPHYLYVSRLIQQTEVEVTEDGTVAASGIIASISYKSPPATFKANRPFIYFIVNKSTKTILFTGQVVKPTASN